MKTQWKKTMVCGVAAAASLAVQAISHVDVLVAFDTTAVAAAEAAGTTLQAFAEEQIAKANEVLKNSGLSNDFDFRLADTYEWAGSYETYGSINGIVDTIEAVIDGTSASTEVDALRTARDAAGADVVVTIVSPAVSDRQKGAGFGMDAAEIKGAIDDGFDSPMGVAFVDWYADRPYCVVEYAAATDGYSFVHEVGHLMGAGHADILASQPGPQLYSYSSAWMVKGSDGNYYSTVMGYNKDGSADSPTYEILPYFSSPDLKNPTTGEALGDATHDNVQTLRNTCAAVESFRKTKLPEGGTTPTGDGGSETSDGGNTPGDDNTNVRPVPVPTPVPTPATSTVAQFTEKKTIIDAAVLDSGEVVGLAQFVVAATRKGVSKVSGTVIGLDGKKKKVKNTKCIVYGEDVALVDLEGVVVKGLDGTLSVTLGSDGSLTNGKIGSLTIEAAEVGVSGTSAYFWIDEQIASIMGDVVIAGVVDGGSEYPTLPYVASPEEVGLGLKWTVAKASKIKAKRDRDTGETNIIATGTENLSGLKLTYQAKTGTFKGSFTAYALTTAGKLKKYKFNVTGVAVNGEGVGIAVCKKAGLTLPVYVGKKPELPPAQEVGCDSCTATPEATCESCSATPGATCESCSAASGATCESCSAASGATCESCSAAPGATCESCTATPGATCESCSATPGATCESCTATPGTAVEAAEATSEG